MVEPPTPGMTRTVTVAPLIPARKNGAEPPVFLPEEVVAGRFRIVRPLGVGGMGQVFEAEDLELGSSVALKVIRPGVAHATKAEELFRREVQLARQVTHPNVCRIFDLVVHHPGVSGTRWGEGDRPILALTMELLSGETLATRLARQGPLSWLEALDLLRQLAAALDAAHDVGVYHCDFKPSNVVLTPIRAVVTDFGLARSAWTEDEGVGASLRGTPAYLAPEVLAGSKPGAAADRYALGVVAFQMLTGRLPDEGSLDGSPELPQAVDTVLRRALHREPAERFTEAAALVAALQEIQRAVRVRPRRRWLAAVLSILLLMLVFLLASDSWQPSLGADQLSAEAHLEDARRAMKEVDYPRTRAAAARAVLIAQTTGNSALEVEGQLLAAGALEAMGEVSRADEAMSGARRILEAAGDRCGLARASLIFRDTTDRERVPIPLAELPEVLEACGDALHQAIALARLAKRRMEADPPTAEAMVRRALSLAEASGDARAQAEVWNVIGSLEYGREDLNASEAAFARAVAEARRAEDPYLVAGMLCNQSWLLGWLGRHQEEEAVLREAASLTRRIGNRYLLARILLTEATQQERQGSPDKVAARLEEAHRISLDLGDAKLIGISLDRLATFHEQQQDWDRAIAARKQVRSLRRDVGIIEDADRDTLKLARLYLKVGRVEESETLVSSIAEGYALGNDSDSTALYSRLQQVQIDLHRGQVEKAAELFQQILPRVIDKEEVGLRRDAAHLAAELDRRLGEPRCAIAWKRLSAASPIAAAASPERIDHALRLRLDLARLLWFQGDEASARQQIQAAAWQARLHERADLSASISQEADALQNWRVYWAWQH